MIADVTLAAVQPVEVAVESPVQEEPLSQAEQLIISGALPEAREQLLTLEKQRPDDSQIQFLLGLTSFAMKDYDGAIIRYRRILANEPNAVRVRLELGRTYFAKRDLRNAERQFQFARSGKLPPGVLKNVDAYLLTIRQNRTFEVSVSLALAPDTNINAGPSVSDVLIFGLPFQLSPDAKSNSGIGLALGGRVKWTPRLSRQLRWDVGMAADARRYGKIAFNDTAVVAFTGPHVVLDRLDASLNARTSRRWYGGSLYAKGNGASLDLTYYLSSRTGFFSTLNIIDLSYPAIPVQDGLLRESVTGFFHALTPSSRGRVSLTVARQGAKVPALANRVRGAEIGYLREVKGGFTFNLAARYRQTRYDAVLPAFGLLRRDDQLTGQVTALNRRIMFRGFTPTLSVTHTRNFSTLSLYRFGRTQLEFGVTRVF